MCCTGLAATTGRKKVAKNRHLGTIAQLRRAIFATKAHIDNRKKNLLSSNTSSTCPYSMVNFGLLSAEILSLVWAPLQISTGFASWQRYCTASGSGRQPNFAALNRGRHLYSAGDHHVGHWPTFLVLLLSSSFFPRLISAVGDWMFTILWHMVWP